MAEKAEKKITVEDVLACYKYIFGRQPESREVIDLHYNACNTIEELREAFFQSIEFQLSNHANIQTTDDYGIKEYQIQNGEGQTDIFYWAYKGSATDGITFAVKENQSFCETIELLKIAEKFCSGKNRNFLDLGANIGAFSLLFAKAGWKCFSAEAGSFNVHALEFSKKINDLDITIIPKVIHEKTGKMYFVQSGPFGFVQNEVYDQSEYEELDAICLDDLLLKSGDLSEIRFIKMDIEGSEAAALRGGRKFLEKNGFPPIYCEFNKWTLYIQKESVSTLTEEFRRLGYVPFQLSEGKLYEVTDPQNQIEVVGNYLFIHDVSAVKDSIDEKKISILDRNYEETYFAYLSDERLSNIEKFITLNSVKENSILCKNQKMRKLCKGIEQSLRDDEFISKLME